MITTLKTSRKNFKFSESLFFAMGISAGIAFSVFLNMRSPGVVDAQETSAPVSIRNIDLTAAGYVVKKQELPTATMYQKPAVYFEVSNPSGQASVDSLLMISQVFVGSSPATLFDYANVVKPFAVVGGIGQEASVDNGQRTAINFLKDGMYVVLIGPYSNHLESLATTIANRL